MADKQQATAPKATRGRRSALPTDVLGAVDDLVTASKRPGAPVPKKARRKIQKLGKQLDAVRATEAKRLRQSAKARQEAAKRDRQAAAAAARMASILSTIRDTAGGPAATTPKRAATTANPAAAARPASAAKAPVATKPATPTKSVKPAGATKAATAAKSATRRPASATQAAKPTRRVRTTAARPAKPKPTT